MDVKGSARRRLLKQGGVALAGLAAGARSASGQTFGSTRHEGHDRDSMIYGERSRYVTTVRARLGNKVNMNMHGDPNGYDALTPLAELEGIITPPALHFVSSHGNAPPDINPAHHRLLIHGLVERPLVFTMAELRRLPSVSRICFIECLANRPTPGEEKTLTELHGMISCSEWTGVPLSLLLKEAGVKNESSWILGESAEATRAARSLPLAKAMDDAIVAYGQNGEPVRPHNGFPLRLVTPGFEGKYQVKWLKGIRVVDRPYVTYWEQGTFTNTGRTQGAYFMEQGPKSVITYPAAGARLAARGFHSIVGLAWSGSGAIRRVEVSTDGGRTWNDAQIQQPALPVALTRFQYPWTWNGEEAVLQSRCTDEHGQVQPASAEHAKFWAPHTPPHGNMIQPWRITPTGQVLNAL
jgi:sulfane dehydrogenase subunit SoxC